jgi:MFS family permease
VVSLAVIIGTRSYLGVDAFNEWGWRIPFIISFLLMAIAIYIRLSLAETPVFQEIKAKGQTATNPWREAFLSGNIWCAVIASIVVLGQGRVWYSGHFWVLCFLQTVKKETRCAAIQLRRSHRAPDRDADAESPAWSAAESDRPATWHKYQGCPAGIPMR